MPFSRWTSFRASGCAASTHLEGKQQHVSAPTTLVFRREDGEWKYLLFHLIPLPPER